MVQPRGGGGAVEDRGCRRTSRSRCAGTSRCCARPTPSAATCSTLATAAAMREAVERLGRDPAGALRGRSPDPTASSPPAPTSARSTTASADENLAYNRRLRAAVNAVAALPMPTIAARQRPRDRRRPRARPRLHCCGSPRPRRSSGCPRCGSGSSRRPAASPGCRPGPPHRRRRAGAHRRADQRRRSEGARAGRRRRPARGGDGPRPRAGASGSPRRRRSRPGDRRQRCATTANLPIADANAARRRPARRAARLAPTAARAPAPSSSAASPKFDGS